MRFGRTRTALFIGIVCALIASAIAGRGDGLYVPAPSWTYSITSLGTGVATALGINVGSAGGPVTNGGALGTPSSGVGTNLTGTAAGFTAGSVTTNANLTGDVTSVGNATTLAASSRLKSKVVSTTYAMTTATGTQAITGYGFQPTTCFAAGNLGSGSLTANTVIFAMADSSRSAVSEYLTGSVIAKTTAAFLNFSDTTATNNQVATISSYDSDGLTLSWTKTGSPTGTAFFDIMCYR